MKRKKHKRVPAADKGPGVTMKIIELPEPTCEELIEAHLMGPVFLALCAHSLEGMFNQHAKSISGLQINYELPMEKSDGRQQEM